MTLLHSNPARAGREERPTQKLYPGEYRSWAAMLTRVRNPNSPTWKHYGGKGIDVCARWLSFQKFFADMGPKLSPKHTLDRYPNPSGNYEPSNCRWATRKEQARNWENRNHNLTFHGKTQPLVVWSEELGIASATLRDRLKAGWTVEQTLTVPAVTERKRGWHGRFSIEEKSATE